METLTLLDLAVGKEMMIDTEMKVTVRLTIESIEIEHHSRQITPATPQNDWWGESQEWQTYLVKFTNGAKKSFQSLSEIKLIK